MSSLPAPITTASDSSPVWGWVRLRALVVESVSSAHSRRAYTGALDDFRRWSQRSERRIFTRETVQQYRVHPGVARHVGVSSKRASDCHP
jgi:hypothetical protein